MTYIELIHILEHDWQYTDLELISTIDEMVLKYYDHLDQKKKARVNDAIFAIKWNDNKSKRGLPYETVYHIGTPPYASIYADVIMYYGFWPAQKMFGKAKTPYLLDENGEVPK